MFWKKKSDETFQCTECGETHIEWPSLTFNSPSSYHGLSEDKKKLIANISSDFCEINYEDQTDRFIRVVLKQKIKNCNQILDYGLWVSLSKKSWIDYKTNYENKSHIVEYFGWLNSKIPQYESTINIPTTVYTREGKQRPEIIPFQDHKHKFIEDYYNGISKEEAEKRIHEMT